MSVMVGKHFFTVWLFSNRYQLLCDLICAIFLLQGEEVSGETKDNLWKNFFEEDKDDLLFGHSNKDQRLDENF